MQTQHKFPGHPAAHAQPVTPYLQAQSARRHFSAPVRFMGVAALAIGLCGCQQLSLPGQPVAATTAGPSANAATHAILRQPRFADFSAIPVSKDARFIANWVMDSGDNQQMPFVIIDKKSARVFVFNPGGKLLGASAVLLGAAMGDDSAPGIGTRPLAEVLPEEKTTPAGRFVGEPGRNMSGEDIVWVDYDAAVSMHRVRTANSKERRLARLASGTTDDNRISFGCVNMPPAFYENVLSPQFRNRYGVVYVLPDVKRISEVFANAYDPAARHRAALLVRRADAASAKTRTRL